MLAAIAVAWVAAVVVELSGAAGSVHHDNLLESGPAFGPALLFFLLAWQVMTAAMMLPSSLPLVRMYVAASAHAPGGRAALAAFLGGYAAMWSAFGAMAFLGDAGLHAAVDASPWLTEHEWALPPGVLLLAGAFQFSSLKDACLRSCRHPASFLRRHYRRGARPGFMPGAPHGAFCVGCCWALMLVMFAAGARQPRILKPPLDLRCRGVAQPGSAPPLGGGGSRFKSGRPDLGSAAAISSPVRPRSSAG